MTQEHSTQTTTSTTAASGSQDVATAAAAQSPAASGSSTATTQEFRIPEEYKDRGWFEKAASWKSQEDMIKAYDNAQTLIGKRPAGIPTTDASDSDWDAFYKAAGRPDKPEYQFSDIEGVPEGFDAAPYKTKASEILHAAGLNQKQADKVFKAWMQSELAASGEHSKTNAAEQEKLDAEFDKLSKEHFGDRYDEVVTITTEDFNKHVPQSLKGAFKHISDNPQALAAIAAYADGKQKEINALKAEYGAEGKTVNGDTSAGQGIEQVRDKLAVLRTSVAARDFLNPENKSTLEEINRLSSIVSRHYKQS